MCMRRDATADEAFVEFALASQARLQATAYLLCGDWDRAADHVQEGLIRVYMAWPRLVRKGRELAYARKAVTSAFLDASRKRSNTERPMSVLPDHQATSDQVAEFVHRDELLRALAQLPPRQRACVVLRYLEELDVRETATALRCSEGAVKSQTSRALRTLRTMLEPGHEQLVPEGRNLK